MLPNTELRSIHIKLLKTIKATQLPNSFTMDNISLKPKLYGNITRLIDAKLYSLLEMKFNSTSKS